MFNKNFLFSEIKEDELRGHFLSCGKIDSVRIVKDRTTGLNRGVGYVNFVEEDSVTLALELNNTMLKNRSIRVTKCCSPKNTKQKRKNNNANEEQNKKSKIFDEKLFKNNVSLKKSVKLNLNRMSVIKKNFIP